MSQDARMITTEHYAQGGPPKQSRGGRRGRGRGRGRGAQNNNQARKDYNNKRMEDHRLKTGYQTLINNQEDIKSEIFAFISNEQLEKLTQNVNKKPQMLPVTSQVVGLATANLTYTTRHYRRNLEIPDIYQMYRFFLAAFEAKIIRIRKESGLMLRNA
ncbi:unnamed protein product [Arctia plantaginis]|uniref:Uncharacterized protein n=1 Tax=Arctia plantaginis TaxID=874455 RepID=A0A8S0ZJN1_ARCPL|nr:unnamed protein product [Arctia plantaginis]CAB3252451.1 unnamed protein product [Arctia plantaginis]